jgi:hypothetical protein
MGNIELVEYVGESVAGGQGDETVHERERSLRSIGIMHWG